MIHRIILSYFSLRFNFSSTVFRYNNSFSCFPDPRISLYREKKKRKKSEGGGKNTRSIFNSTKWPKVAGANSANSKRSSAFVIWIRGNRKRWRAKLISNRVWKSIEGGTLVRPSRPNRIQCLCFVSILFSNLSARPTSNLVRWRRIVIRETNVFLTIIHWICLKWQCVIEKRKNCEEILEYY